LAVDDGRLEGIRPWVDLARRLPRPYAAARLFLAGWCAYLQGNGALAGIAADLAAAAGPGIGPLPRCARPRPPGSIRGSYRTCGTSRSPTRTGLISAAVFDRQHRRPQVCPALEQGRLFQGHLCSCPSARTIGVVALTVTRWPPRRGHPRRREPEPLTPLDGTPPSACAGSLGSSPPAVSSSALPNSLRPCIGDSARCGVR